MKRVLIALISLMLLLTACSSGNNSNNTDSSSNSIEQSNIDSEDIQDNTEIYLISTDGLDVINKYIKVEDNELKIGMEVKNRYNVIINMEIQNVYIDSELNDDITASVTVSPGYTNVGELTIPVESDTDTVIFDIAISETDSTSGVIEAARFEVDIQQQTITQQ